MLPIPFHLFLSQHRNIRFITQEIKPFVNNLVFHHTTSFPFETEAPFIHTIRLLREYLDS